MLDYFNIIGFSALYTLFPESFPTEIRGVAMAYISCCARIGGILSPIITGLVLDYYTRLVIPLSIFAGCYLLGASSVLFLKETKVKENSNKLMPG